ncbi:hypothetical protein Bpfe_030543, partial [Biomphalaria pfeifferi]
IIKSTNNAFRIIMYWYSPFSSTTGLENEGFPCVVDKLQNIVLLSLQRTITHSKRCALVRMSKKVRLRKVVDGCNAFGGRIIQDDLKSSCSY